MLAHLTWPSAAVLIVLLLVVAFLGACLLAAVL